MENLHLIRTICVPTPHRCRSLQPDNTAALLHRRRVLPRLMVVCKRTSNCSHQTGESFPARCHGIHRSRCRTNRRRKHRARFPLRVRFDQARFFSIASRQYPQIIMRRLRRFHRFLKSIGQEVFQCSIVFFGICETKSSTSCFPGKIC